MAGPRPTEKEDKTCWTNAANVTGLLALTVAGFLLGGSRPRKATLTSSHHWMLRGPCFHRTASIMRRNLRRRFRRTASPCDCVRSLLAPPASTKMNRGTPGPTADTQQQFSATVNNGSSQTVTWAVTGGSANGTIDANGMYTAPATTPSPATVTITATSTLATSPGVCHGESQECDDCGRVEYSSHGDSSGGDLAIRQPSH